jgi:hypothetical protein
MIKGGPVTLEIDGKRVSLQEYIEKHMGEFKQAIERGEVIIIDSVGPCPPHFWGPSPLINVASVTYGVDKVSQICPKCKKENPEPSDKCYYCDTNMPNQNGDIFNYGEPGHIDPKTKQHIIGNANITPEHMEELKRTYNRRMTKTLLHGNWDKPEEGTCERCGNVLSSNGKCEGDASSCFENLADFVNREFPRPHSPKDCPNCNFERQTFCGEYVCEMQNRYIKEIAKLKYPSGPQPKTLIIRPKDIDVEIEGTNGIRLRGSNLRNFKIEALDEDGNWQPMPHVKSVNIKVDVEKTLPIVTIEQYIFKKA